MVDVTVDQFMQQVTQELGLAVKPKLLEQLQKFNISPSAKSSHISQEVRKQITEEIKKTLNEPATTERRKISLRRVEHSVRDARTADGKKATVSVISKKRRTYVKAETAEVIESEVETIVEAIQVIETISDSNNVVTPIDTVINDVTSVKEDVKDVGTAVVQAPVVKPVSDATNKDDKSKIKKDDKKDDKKDKNKKEKNSKFVFDDAKKPRKAAAKGPLIVDDEEEVSFRRRPKKFKRFSDDVKSQAFVKPVEPKTHEIKVPETITVAELAHAMSVKVAAVIKVLMGLGMMATINQVIDQDTACLLVEEMGHKATPVKDSTLEDDIEINYSADELVHRSPIVTVMGHVDHGKTSLLDAIRKTKVTDSEAGGITQHIGAYQVKTSKGLITFLDTPGHAAFTAMRARGADCTDIVILVVAADDGVMPQTVEAIHHAKAANVPIVVAITKIDKHDSDIERVINELSQYSIMPESWGGDTMFCQVSALTGEGIEELLETVMLQSEVLELTAVPKGQARGVVIEARVDRGRGPVATLLVQSGELKTGDTVLAGLEYGRIRAMISDEGKNIVTAGPSVPVEVLGLTGAPNAGDIFQVVESERKAREVATYRQTKYREHKIAKQLATKMEGFLDRMKNVDVKVLNIVLKADVQGSVEALTETVQKLSNDEIAVKVVGSGVGGFNESDINLALASGGILIGFNVRADASARKLAIKEGVTINYYSIIYDVLDDLKQLLLGRLGPQLREKIIGLAEVRDVFRSTKLGAIAGCMVIDGIIKRGNPIRVLRDNIVIYQGELESLRRFKEAVNEVRNGMECGIGVKNYNDVKPKDQIEVFEIVEVAREEL